MKNTLRVISGRLSVADYFLNTGDAVVPLMLSPALSPWETTLSGVMGGTGNNPSLRLVQYDRLTGSVLNILQYWLNLTQANMDRRADWQEEYNAVEYYNIPNLSAQSLDKLARDMDSDDELFDRYYKANGVLYDPDETWDDEIRAVHLCSITQLSYEDYQKCYDEKTEGPPSRGVTVHHGGAGGVTLITALLLAQGTARNKYFF